MTLEAYVYPDVGSQVRETGMVECLTHRANIQGYNTSTMVFGDGTILSLAAADVFDQITGSDMVNSTEIAQGIQGVLGFLASRSEGITS